MFLNTLLSNKQLLKHLIILNEKSLNIYLNKIMRLNTQL
jgi:hypothetical protein